MPTRNVVLTAHQSALVERLLKSGRYQNASEILREGLRLIEAREAEEQAKLEALRTAAQRGIDDIEGGRYRTIADRAGLRELATQLTEEALAGRSAPSRS